MTGRDGEKREREEREKLVDSEMKGERKRMTLLPPGTVLSPSHRQKMWMYGS